MKLVLVNNKVLPPNDKMLPLKKSVLWVPILLPLNKNKVALNDKVLPLNKTVLPLNNKVAPFNEKVFLIDNKVLHSVTSASTKWHKFFTK